MVSNELLVLFYGVYHSYSIKLLVHRSLPWHPPFQTFLLILVALQLPTVQQSLGPHRGHVNQWHPAADTNTNMVSKLRQTHTCMASILRHTQRVWSAYCGTYTHVCSVKCGTHTCMVSILLLARLHTWSVYKRKSPREI